MQRLRVATEMISEASKVALNILALDVDSQKHIFILFLLLQAIRDIKFSLVMPLFPFLLHLLVLAQHSNERSI